MNGSKIEEGDTIIAISSNGPHSNGFSLIRKLFVDLNEVYENKKNMGTSADSDKDLCKIHSETYGKCKNKWNGTYNRWWTDRKCSKNNT